jgi:membrane associated rhomboid family serine protease
VARYGSQVDFQFGPGRPTPAVKLLLITNVVAYLLNLAVPAMTLALGLSPRDVFGSFAIWQPVTYMFLHDTGGVGHILFNMLALWMFGTELERIWGTQQFLKFYFVCGIGAAFLTVLFSLLPFGFAQPVYQSIVIGASGAIYGLLLAYALYFPDRPILAFMLFPMPAKYFVLLIGAIAFY